MIAKRSNVVVLNNARWYAEYYRKLSDPGPGYRQVGNTLDENLVMSEIDSRSYTASEDFAADYQLAEGWSKATFLNLDINPKRAAIDKFLEAEVKCEATNRRIRKALRGSGEPLGMGGLIARQRQIIESLLGDVDRVNPWDSLRQCRWTTGATSSLKRSRSNVDQKMTTLPITCTLTGMPYIKRELECDPNWFECLAGLYPSGPYSMLRSTFKVSEWNRVLVVEKNAKTGRTIAAEPTANLFMQKSIGLYLRRRLKRRGIDLSDQGVNQRMAALAYHWDYATIDKSMASDTVSVEVVRDLLPPAWFQLLDDLRSKSGKFAHKADPFRYQKFSSMGNAFTFELETIIFYSAAIAVLEEDGDPRPSFVYGDDVILPNSSLWRYITYLSWLGFDVNTKKSHYGDDPLRESCGAHYWKGEYVTPFYQKREIDCDFEAIRFANRLFRYAIRTGSFPAVATRERLLEDRPWLRRFGCPIYSEADDYLICDSSEQFSGVVAEDRNRGVKVRTLRRFPKRQLAHEHALYAYALRLGADHAPDRLEFLEAPNSGSVSTDPLQDRFQNDHWVEVGFTDRTSYRWVMPTA